jgi:hypothetical protein
MLGPFSSKMSLECYVDTSHDFPEHLTEEGIAKERFKQENITCHAVQILSKLLLLLRAQTASKDSGSYAHWISHRQNFFLWSYKSQ